MGPKIVSSSILMRTEGPNFGRRFDPFWVRKWPVGTEVRSHFRTFIAVDLNLKISPTKILPLIIALITLDAYSVSAFEAQSESHLMGSSITYSGRCFSALDRWQEISTIPAESYPEMLGHHRETLQCNWFNYVHLLNTTSTRGRLIQ